MKTAIQLLSEKRNEIMAGPQSEEMKLVAWVNFLEAMLLMAAVNAMCFIDDPDPQNWKKRIEAALGRDAALLISLGDKVPTEKLVLPA